MKLLKIKTIVSILLCSSTLLVFQGCGHKTQETVPADATIEINPSSVSYSNAFLVGDIIQNYEVVVRDKEANPIPKVGLSLSGSFAFPVSNTTGLFTSPRYQFYYYKNGYNNPDNVKVDSGYTAQTNNNGVYEFSVVIFSQITLTAGGPSTTNAFNDVIYISSGAVQNSAKLSVVNQ